MDCLACSIQRGRRWRGAGRGGSGRIRMRDDRVFPPAFEPATMVRAGHRQFDDRAGEAGQLTGACGDAFTPFLRQRSGLAGRCAAPPARDGAGCRVPGEDSPCRRGDARAAGEMAAWLPETAGPLRQGTAGGQGNGHAWREGQQPEPPDSSGRGCPAGRFVRVREENGQASLGKASKGETGHARASLTPGQERPVLAASVSTKMPLSMQHASIRLLTTETPGCTLWNELSQYAATCCRVDLTGRSISVAASFRVTVNLEEPEYAVLSALSGKHRVSLAWLGRQAIIEFLERHEDEKVQLPLILSAASRPADD